MSNEISLEEEMLTELLDLECWKSKEKIKPGELVELHDWGVNSSDNVIAIGHFEWDEQHRKFDFIYRGPSADIDDYDMFRTTPSKLLYFNKN